MHPSSHLILIICPQWSVASCRFHVPIIVVIFCGLLHCPLSVTTSLSFIIPINPLAPIVYLMIKDPAASPNKKLAQISDLVGDKIM
jgi:hypothetical protein